MALPDKTQWASPTARSSGITNASIAAGTNFLGNAVAQGTNLDRWSNIEVAWVEGATPPTAGAALKLAVLYSFDGTNYEAGAGDGSNASNDVDPAGATVVGACIARGAAGTYRRMFTLPLAPHNFKTLLVSELSQTVTATVSIDSFNESLVD